MSNEPLLAHVNGIESKRISIADRGLAFGDGIFDTLLWRHSQPQFLSLHIDRLVQGLQVLRIALSRRRLEEALDNFFVALKAHNLADAVIKTIVSRGEGRGFLPAGDIQASIIIAAYPFKINHDQQRDGVSLILCQGRLRCSPDLAGLKHLNQLDHVLAALEVADRNADEGLLLDVDGNVVETVSSNVFMMLDGKLQTPSLKTAGVEGTIRRVVLEALAPNLSIEAIEATIAYEHLVTADEIFICNSIAGIRPVNNLEGRKLPIGPITRKLQHELTELQHRQEKL